MICEIRLTLGIIFKISNTGSQQPLTAPGIILQSSENKALTTQAGPKPDSHWAESHFYGNL